MAKLFKLSEETQSLIDNIVGDAGLDRYMNIKCFGTKKQKQVFKVKKASPTEEGMGNSPDTVIIIVAENGVVTTINADGTITTSTDTSSSSNTNGTNNSGGSSTGSETGGGTNTGGGNNGGGDNGGGDDDPSGFEE